MKITASVTESSHQDRSPCCLHLPIFFTSPLQLENKKLLWSLIFLSKLDHRWCTCSFLLKTLFSTQSQLCLTFSLTELKMLPRCCLIHRTILRLRCILYLVYFWPCLGLDQFILYLCDLSFYFQPHFHYN